MIVMNLVNFLELIEADEEVVEEITADVITKETEVTVEAPQEDVDFTFEVPETEAEFVIQKGEDTEAELQVGGSTYILCVSF
jgi:hypothetical protein